MDRYSNSSMLRCISSGNNHDLLLTNFLGDVVDVSSMFPYNSTRSILHSF
jgi:hypothetical protein